MCRRQAKQETQRKLHMHHSLTDTLNNSPLQVLISHQATTEFACDHTIKHFIASLAHHLMELVCVC